MIALFTFVPMFCPHCGRKIDLKDTCVRQDYEAKASFHCLDCNLNYQYVDATTALDAAEKAGGDLKQEGGR
jgi:transposase-like protein